MSDVAAQDPPEPEVVNNTEQGNVSRGNNRLSSPDRSQSHDSRKNKESTRHRPSRSESRSHSPVSRRSHRRRHRYRDDRTPSPRRDRSLRREDLRRRSSRRSRSRRRDYREEDRDRDREERRKRDGRRREGRSRSRSKGRDGESQHRNRRGRERRQTDRDALAFHEEMAQLDRTMRTVQVYNLSLRAGERELFQFFSQAGPLVDIKIIRDKASGRSKGFAYVEFKEKASVMTALALTGQPLLGQPVMVKMSEAEKNVAWEAAQLAKKQGLDARTSQPMSFPNLYPAADAVNQTVTGPSRLLVSNLHPSITASDLQPIFEPFGSIDFVTIQRDAAGNSTGRAIVQYAVESEGARAAEKLNNSIDIGGMTLKVELAPQGAQPSTAAAAASVALAGMMTSDTLAAGEGPMVTEGQNTKGGAEDDVNAGSERIDFDATDGGGLRLTAQLRASLMSHLGAKAGIEVPQMPQTLLPAANKAGASDVERNDLVLEQGVLGPASPKPAQCLLLKNMFDPAEETEPEWNREIEEDVRDECSKYGRVEFVHVDVASKGFVYLKFDAVEAAVAAQRALHGRWFNKRQLHAEFQFTPLFNSHFQL